MLKNKESITIVKIGGNIIDAPSDLDAFLSAFSKIKGYKILVHGGGKAATKLAESLGLKPLMIEGRRITVAEMLDVVVMVYAGINKSIVAKLQAKGINTFGFSGADGNLIQSQKRNHPTIDYGYVGEVKNINISLLEMLLSNGITPVFSAITHDGNGQLLNTNADTIASELAIALASKYEITLHYCFEKKGVLSDVNQEDAVITNINYELYTKLKAENKIHSGMIPKLDNCFNSLSKGVHKIKIGHPVMLLEEASLHTTITYE